MVAPIVEAMEKDWARLVARWQAAGLIDTEAAARIRAFEEQQTAAARLRWPIIVALAFGAVMLAGGVLLWVAAHWDTQSPGERFALVIVLVAAFHVAGAVAAVRFHAMAVALHAIGTISLGAGVFLAGQIFNLNEHWPSGVLLWAVGAAVAWALVGHIPQMLLTSVLAPAWIASEWLAANADQFSSTPARVLATGTFLLAIAYFAAPGPRSETPARRALAVLGGFALVPASITLAAVSAFRNFGTTPTPATSWALGAVGWSVAVGLPLVIAAILRGREAWPNGIAALWVIASFRLTVTREASTLPLYPWWALLSIGLVAWGVRDGRSERVNMGAAMFGATVLAFYFSHVMDKLERSASLVGLGLLFLGGGWMLERARRRLVSQARRPT